MLAKGVVRHSAANECHLINLTACVQFDGGRTYTEPSVIMTGRPEKGEGVSPHEMNAHLSCSANMLEPGCMPISCSLLCSRAPLTAMFAELCRSL